MKIVKKIWENDVTAMKMIENKIRKEEIQKVLYYEKM